jgi:hypothetical protein
MEKTLCSKLGIALLIVVSIFILTAAAALAASSAQLGPSLALAPKNDLKASILAVTGMVNGTQTISPTRPVSGTNMVGSAIALFFNVPVSDVVSLRSDGYGYGEIAKAYFLALGSGMTIDEITALRDSGMGWGQIAKHVGQPPGNHGQNLGMVMSGRGTLSDTISGGPTISPTQSISPTQPVSGTNMVGSAIASFFSVPVSDVVSLRSGGYGYGEISKLYFLANFLGLSPDLGLTFDDAVSVIRATREISRTGWGRLTMDLGLRPGNHGCNLGMIVSGRGTLEDCLPDDTETSVADTETGKKGQGNPQEDKQHGNPHEDKQQGNPHGDDHPGQGQGKGKGHDKDRDRGGGKKH